MQEKQAQILQEVGDLFMRYGIKSVTMDDVAKSLKMSKKTLYQHVSDKQDLVKKVMSGYCELDKLAVHSIIEMHGDNAIDEILAITKYVTTQIKNIHPSIHYDLEKYYPEAWAEMNAFKVDFIYQHIAGNLERGIDQGLYRPNVNVAIIAKLYVTKLDIVFDPAVFPTREFQFVDVYMEMMRYHVRGVASEKGLKYLQEKSAQEKLNFN